MTRRSFISNQPAASIADSDAILRVLTTRQYLNPREPLGEVFRSVIEQLDCCPQALARATEWLKLDPSALIGRLRRTELMQLSRAIHRFWEQNAADRASASSSR